MKNNSAYTEPKFVLCLQIGETVFTGYVVVHISGIKFYFTTLEATNNFLCGGV